MMPRGTKDRVERQQALVAYLNNNPFLTDKDLARILNVSIQTVRLDRACMNIPELRERINKAARGEENPVRSLSSGELYGELVDIKVGYQGTSILSINNEMVFQRNKVARGHHLFAQANSLAVAVIDAETALTGSARVYFKTPVHLGDKVVAQATLEKVKGNKHVVRVIASVKDKKILEGVFTIFALTEEGKI